MGGRSSLPTIVSRLEHAAPVISAAARFTLRLELIDETLDLSEQIPRMKIIHLHDRPHQKRFVSLFFAEHRRHDLKPG
jgi:hypothetical protein